jgi:hypothetical protein
MTHDQIIKLKQLLKTIDFSKGTDEYQKWVDTLLTFLDGILSNFE